MNIVIISTYPESGSKNIGDKLITDSTIGLLESTQFLDDSNEIHTVWRGDSYENVRPTIEQSEIVIFACLAIRHNMAEVEYPYLQNILALKNKRIFIFAAGTHLNHFKNNSTWFEGVSPLTLKCLKELNEKAEVFSTRGLLTQYFCNKIGLDRVRYFGDIALVDSRFNARKFELTKNVKRIAVSDPHYAKLFLPSFIHLINSIKFEFPRAEIHVLLHGVNKIIEDYCEQNDLAYHLVYAENSGLDVYDNYDIHIGYRIHGCISMLKRCKPSYLLEQDARGLDYGVSFSENISVSSVIRYKPSLNPKRLLKVILKGSEWGEAIVDTKSVDMLMSIIAEDRKHNFNKFLGLEGWIKSIVNKYKESLLDLI